MILVYVILSRRIPRMKSNRNIYKGRFLYFRSDSIHLVPLSASQYTITYSAYTPFFYIRAITYRFCSILYAISTADAFDVCCCCCSQRISEELSNSKIDSTSQKHHQFVSTELDRKNGWILVGFHLWQLVYQTSPRRTVTYLTKANGAPPLLHPHTPTLARQRLKIAKKLTNRFSKWRNF